MNNFPESAHWRDSARTARFLIIDARSIFPFVLFLLHIQWWTFIVACISTLFFVLLEHYGFTVPVFLRWLRNMLVGNHKLSRPWWRE